MCLDGNFAPASVRYLNSQLSALWQNAVACASHFGTKASVDLSSSAYIKSRYTRSLAQWHYAGEQPVRGPIRKEDLLFSGSFGQPKLQFVCNHEVILHLHLLEGHLNTHAAEKPLTNVGVNTDDNMEFKDLEIAVRMNFSRRGLGTEDALIGNGGHIIQLMVLEFSSATLFSQNTLPQTALSSYIRTYLALLRDAGHHVLFDLPDFDEDEYSPLIDYALGVTTADLDAHCTDVALHGVPISVINDQLRRAWLKAAASARGLSGPVPSNRLETCLMEIKSTWLPDVQTHFHLKFAPPIVRAICAQEAVLYFNIESVLFYSSADLSLDAIGSYSGWQIAVIVDVIRAENDERTVVGVDIDFSTVRFCRHLSHIPETDETALTFFQKIVQFITVSYSELIVSYKIHQIRVNELLSPEAPICSPSSPPDDEFDIYSEPTTPSDPAMHSSGSTTIGTGNFGRGLRGFDYITSISEASINAMFAVLWKHARDDKTTLENILLQWSYEGVFSSTFEAIKVELLSESKIIVRINITEGSMTLKGRNELVKFSAWTVAFLVDIKSAEHREEEMSRSWLARFRDSFLGRKHEHALIKHLVLDFADAEFLLAQSSLSGLWELGPSAAISQLESIVKHIKLYLIQLVHHGYNVLHSVPLTTSQGSNATSTLTSIAFQTISKITTSVFNRHRVKVAPVLLVTGMRGGRAQPKVKLAWSEVWGTGQTHGSVILSRSEFLEGRLLPSLAYVNARMTVLPRFPRDVHEDEFSVYLATLETHPYRKNKKTEWQLARKQANGLRRYEYEYRDEWTYQHEDSVQEIGAYSVCCHTRNELLIPIVYQHDFTDITIRGVSTLSIKGEDEHKNWNQSSSAKWEATIRIHSEWNGLRLEAITSAPVFDTPEVVGEWTVNAQDLLAAHLPPAINISEALAELKDILEGPWDRAFPGTLVYHLADPLFTANGDLVLQLRLHDPDAKPSAQPTKTKKTLRAQEGKVTVTTATRAASAKPVFVKKPSLFSKVKHFVGDVVHGDVQHAVQDMKGIINKLEHRHSHHSGHHASGGLRTSSSEIPDTDEDDDISDHIAASVSEIAREGEGSSFRDHIAMPVPEVAQQPNIFAADERVDTRSLALGII